MQVTDDIVALPPRGLPVNRGICVRRRRDECVVGTVIRLAVGRHAAAWGERSVAEVWLSLDDQR